MINELCGAEKSKGLEVVLVSTISKENALAGETVNEFKRILFPVSSVSKWGLSLPLAVWLIRQVSLFDLVCIHMEFASTSLVAALVCQFQRVPYVLIPHGVFDSYGLGRNRVLKQAYMRLFGNRNLRNAMMVRCLSEHEKKQILLLKQKCNPVTVPIGTAEETESENSSNRFEKQGLAGVQKVLFVGRFDEKKNIELIVESVAPLFHQMKNVRLVLCGDTDSAYSRHIKKVITNRKDKERIEVIPFLHGKELCQVYEQAACFLLVSKDENFGLSALEAMAHGIPVVVSREVGLADSIAGSGSGLVIQSSREELTQAVERILSDRETAKRMGLNGMTLVEDHFRWPKIADETERIYRGIIDKCRPNRRLF